MVKLFLTTIKTVVQHYHNPLFMGNNIETLLLHHPDYQAVVPAPITRSRIMLHDGISVTNPK